MGKETTNKQGGTWAIILAGGEGTRMRSATGRWFGVPRPKQYCTFYGDRSMLRQTASRIRQIVAADHILTVIGKGHQQFIESEAGLGQVIEQPVSRDTAPGMFLPATYIFLEDPDATVLIFPSDHFVFPDNHFAEHMRVVRDLAERFEDKVILTGAVADRPETDYGWIQPGAELEGPGRTARRILSFCEKPSSEDASNYFRNGYFWNTMIIAAKLKTLWNLGSRLLPELMRKFEIFMEVLRIARIRGQSRDENLALAQLYDDLPNTNLSRSFLTRIADQCLLLPLHEVFWSDWGRPERILETLKGKLSYQPTF